MSIPENPGSNPPDNHTYLLPRDDSEGTRLSAQHYALTRRQGWLLHPKVQEAISRLETPLIADVACGTGIWAVEVAEKWPKAFVTGLDISSGQFPPRWTLPSNVTLNTLDLLGEIGPEYDGKFDVVHIQLILTAGPLTDPKNWVKALGKLLKPGGYLQWEDIPYPSMKQVVPPMQNGCGTGDCISSTVLYDNVAKAAHLVYKAGWYTDFHNWMQQNSTFHDIEQFDIPVHLSTLKVENDIVRNAFSSAVRTLLSVVKIDDKALLKGIGEDAAGLDRSKAEGALVTYIWIVGLARAAWS